MDKVSLQAKPQIRLSAPDYVIEQIKQALAEGRLKPGDRLPAETELEVLFGVSRGSIRQAMKSLEMLGVVTIRPGDGTYVNDEMSRNSFNPLIFALLLSQPNAHMIREARYAMERDILELILNDEERVQTVIPLMKENLVYHQTLLDSHASAEELVENDLAFHRILSDACGNMVIKLVYEYVLEAFRSIIVSTTTAQLASETSYTIRDHTGILNAIEQRDYAIGKEAVKNSAKSWRDLM